MKELLKKLLCKLRGHQWKKLGGAGSKDDGYVFVCKRCGAEGFCRHLHVILDVEQRTVECSTCGARIDPFDFLLHTAAKEEQWYYRADELKKKAETLQAIKERLEKDIKNLESKIKRRTT